MAAKPNAKAKAGILLHQDTWLYCAEHGEVAARLFKGGETYDAAVWNDSPALVDLTPPPPAPPPADTTVDPVETADEAPEPAPQGDGQ